MVRVVDLESLATYRCGLESRQELWILSSEEAVYPATGLLNVGRSTKVPVRAFNNTRRGT